MQMNHLWKQDAPCISREAKETCNISLDYLIIRKLPQTELIVAFQSYQKRCLFISKMP